MILWARNSSMVPGMALLSHWASIVVIWHCIQLPNGLVWRIQDRSLDGSCGLSRGPRDIQVLILETQECHLTWQKALCRCDYIETRQMGGLAWITQGGPNCNQTVLMRGREIDSRARLRENGNRSHESGFGAGGKRP